MRGLQALVFALGLLLALLPLLVTTSGVDEAGARLALRLVGTAIAMAALLALVLRESLLRWLNVVLGIALVAVLPLLGPRGSRQVLLGVLFAAAVAVLSTFGGTSRTGFRSGAHA